MKILFIAPRFHTNQVYWIDSLLENGHHVEFHALARQKAVRPETTPVARLLRACGRSFSRPKRLQGCLRGGAPEQSSSRRDGPVLLVAGGGRRRSWGVLPRPSRALSIRAFGGQLHAHQPVQINLGGRDFRVRGDDSSESTFSTFKIAARAPQ